MMMGAEAASEFELSGGVLCLDFANTLGERPRSESERLGDYGDFLRFSRQAGSIPSRDLEQLERIYADCPERADAAFRRILEVREAIYRLLSSEVLGKSPQESDIETLNRALRKAARQSALCRGKGGYEWHWAGPADALDRPLWPIVRSVVDLLTSDELARLRECDSRTCSWLFIDRSRSRRRRWCDMSTCGNRAKARRHYRKRKHNRKG